MMGAGIQPAGVQMRASSVPRILSSHRRPLAACVAAVFGLAAPAAVTAAMIDPGLVTSCDDSAGAETTVGTLRYAAANVTPGGTIDMSGLLCSVISLQQGAINITQTDLTIQGPGVGSLSVNGKYFKNTTFYSDYDRIFNHTGTGTLKIYDLAVGSAKLTDLVGSHGASKGGCIYSAGSVVLKRFSAGFCAANAVVSGNAYGGAVFAANGLTLDYASLGFNSVYSKFGSAGGGGAWTTGPFSGKFDTIALNTASAVITPAAGFAGGLYVRGSDATIESSTISGNSSTGLWGGAAILSGANTGLTTKIYGSTISGNDAGTMVGGVYSNTATVNIRNSTIAYNTAAYEQKNGYLYAPGLSLGAFTESISATLQSTLISGNTFGGLSTEDDLSAASSSPHTVTFAAGPAYNLVRATSVTHADLPSDTKFGSCPLLAPLAGNGGMTQTHALHSGSVAIDSGSNPAGDTYDQRGLPYLRQDIVSGIPDIGAYEVQQDEIIFNAAFDGCPTLP